MESNLVLVCDPKQTPRRHKQILFLRTYHWPDNPQHTDRTSDDILLFKLRETKWTTDCEIQSVGWQISSPISCATLRPALSWSCWKVGCTLKRK